MSSISSYEVSVDDDFDYMKRLDELESAGSGSSGSEDIVPVSFKNPFKNKTDTDELDTIRIYLKCKRNAFHYASVHNGTNANLLTGLSMLLSGCLVFMPFFTIPHVITTSSAALFLSICFSKYYRFDIYHKQYETVSRKYAALHSNVESFLAKFVYMTDKHTAFYDKVNEIEQKLHWIKEDNRDIMILPHFIRARIPFVSSVDIIQSIHGIEIEQNSLRSRYRNLKYEIDFAHEEQRSKQLKAMKKKIKETLKRNNYTDIKEKLDKEYRDSLIQFDC